MKPVNIGILGLGTVGRGTAEVLRANAAEISRRLGRAVNVFMVSTRDEAKARAACPPETLITADPFEVVRHPEVDIVAEVFGGTEAAKELVLEAIRHGKHVVTANKKLLAEYGSEVFALAEEKNVMVQFEAAVAGGIPVVAGEHVWMADTQTPQSHADWLATLDRIRALDPSVVIPGHYAPGSALDLRAVQFTGDYIRAFDEEAAKATNSAELISAMKARYPHLAGEGSLELSAKVAKGEMQWP